MRSWPIKIRIGLLLLVPLLVCGAVFELHRAKIEAYGIDGKLGQSSNQHLYQPPAEAVTANGILLDSKFHDGFFIQGEGAYTGFAPAQFDVVVDSFALFEYAANVKEDFDVALYDHARILKPGGELYDPD